MDCTVIHVIVCLYVIQGVLSRTVSITVNTTGLEGTNGTNLKCVFTKDDGDFIASVTFSARNSSNQFEKIVVFGLFQHDITFFSLWSYLFENVTEKLTPITDQSTTAAEIQINNLLCKHEREYKCDVAFFPKGASETVLESSKIINITVQVNPSKPESIKLLGKLVDNEMPPATKYPPSRLTTESEESVTFTTDGPTKYSPIIEGDNITFSCSGNVGKPPASFQWEKIQHSGVNTTYNDTNTDIIYHSENCSYRRTSNITLQIFAEDKNAIVRCVVVQAGISEDKLFVQTDPIDVLYTVRLPNITKQPNQDTYGNETRSITLTCHSDGNPKPSYVWSKNGNKIHNNSVMMITNVSVNDTGTYTCNVSNYVENEETMYSTSVNIVIVKETVTTTTRRTTTPTASGPTMKDESSTAKNDNSKKIMYIIIGVVAFIVVVIAGIVTVYLYKHQSRSKGYESPLTDKRTKSSPKPQRPADPYSSISLEDKPQRDVIEENTYKENKKHNLQYLKAEEFKAKETKPSEAPVEYAIVDKSKHKYENSDIDNMANEDTYASQPEGLYDTTNDRRHKPDHHAETYDTTNMKRKSQSAKYNDGSTAGSPPYVNQSFEDDNYDKTKDVNKPLYQNEKNDRKPFTSL